MAIAGIDGVLEIEYNDKKAKFNVETKKEIRNYHLSQIYQLAEYNNPLMVITEKNIFPKIKEEFRQHGIAFIDLNDNVDIETDTMLIKVEGKKQNLTKIPNYKKTVIYCLTGRRSAEAITLLAGKYGFENLYNLKEGIYAWADEIDNAVQKY